MVPFCLCMCFVLFDLHHSDGQGMNCGFEDCLVLDAILYGESFVDGHPDEYALTSRSIDIEMLEQRLNDFSVRRHPDAVAMCDLASMFHFGMLMAVYNYVEMRSGVLSISYRFRKMVESFLHRLFPRQIIPLYTMVSFTRLPYSKVTMRWKRQTWWLQVCSSAVFGSIVGVFAMASLRNWCRIYGCGVRLLAR